MFVNSLFSTREIATAIWFSAFIILLFASPKLRNPVLSIINAAITPKLSIPFVLMLIHGSLLVYVLSFMPFWRWNHVKDVLIWFLFSGVPLCYNAIQSVEDGYFKSMVLGNVKFLVLVEFLISSFTFNLITEIILLPAITLIVLLDTVADTRQEFAPVKKLTSFVLAVGGVAFIGFTIAEGIDSYQVLNTVDFIVSIFIPIVFSVLYVPIAYMFAVYTRYESLFIHLGFNEPKDARIRRKRRLQIIRACGLSLERILRFQRFYAKHIYASMTQEEFCRLIKEFRATVETARHDKASTKEASL